MFAQSVFLHSMRRFACRDEFSLAARGRCLFENAQGDGFAFGANRMAAVERAARRARSGLHAVDLHRPGTAGVG